MSHLFIHGDPCLSWRPVADVVGVPLIAKGQFRLVLRRACNTFQLRLLQQSELFSGMYIWRLVTEFTGDHAERLLKEGRAIAYARLEHEGDRIDWDDELTPDLYPSNYCYICDTSQALCIHSKRE